MNNTTDLLQIKIEEAKAQLPENTLKAINAVPWQATILQMRETKGYSFGQLDELVTETELLLCGLLNPESYQKELKDRMKLTDVQVNDLVNEMNKLVFVKIKEELIKGSTNKNENIQNVPTETALNFKEQENDTKILKSAGIEIIPEKLELTSPPPVRSHPLEDESATVTLGRPDSNGTHSFLTQKLSGFVKNDIVETDHSLHNISQENKPSDTTNNKPNIDPYREIPE